MNCVHGEEDKWECNVCIKEAVESWLNKHNITDSYLRDSLMMAPFDKDEGEFYIRDLSIHKWDFSLEDSEDVATIYKALQSIMDRVKD